MDQQIFAHRPENSNGPWDVAIIGSGPAGLTASIYTTRGAASTIIFGGEVWGGQLMLTSNVDNFPSQLGILGPELMGKMREHSVAFGAEFLEKSVESIDVSTRPFRLTVHATPAGGQGSLFTAHSVIIATGAQSIWLQAPGISKLIGRGISSCAPCDAPFFKDKKVAVVGGGDSAMEEALVLTKYALEVTIIHRRDSFKASKVMQSKVLNNPKIKVLWNTEVVEAKGENKLEEVVLKNSQTPSQISNLAVDGLFIAIGHTPATDVFKGQLDLDEKGYMKVTDNTKTSVPGVFSAGDVHDHRYRQAITAAGMGCMAAMDALKYLEEIKT
mgnify:CR=1 FL=1